MIVFPNCKINLGLHITRKRTDGYHDIETVMYPIALYDVLEFIPSHHDSLTVTGFSTEQNNMTDNLVYRALTALRQYKKIPPLKIHLHKTIPLGAGLGGGSSDASNMLLALNKEFDLGLTNNELQNIASDIGSDCPFFILNTPALSLGRGEILSPINIDISDYYLVLVKPQVNISTAEAYALIEPDDSRDYLKCLLEKPITDWSRFLTNDFEKPIFGKHPVLFKIKDSLYKNGAIYVSMSGSGSAIYGIFMEKPDISDFASHYWTYIIEPQRLNQ